MKRPLHELLGEEALVATGDVRYRGVLREVTEERVCLRGRTGWRGIPMARVVAIRGVEPEPAVRSDHFSLPSRK